MKEAIGTGETVNQAQEAACKALGVETYEAEFEILQVPVKRALGIFGSKMAKVKAIIKQKAVPTPTELAFNYLHSVLRAFCKDDFRIEILEETNTGAILVIYVQEIGSLIGKHGATLDALQYLANLVANNGREDYFRIKIDVSNYREKREKALEDLGSKLAIKVIKTHKACTLEPMNSYDRRIIHLAVRKYLGVESVSQGDGINRHIVISPQENIKNDTTYEAAAF